MITILPLPFLRNHGKILIFGSGKIFKGVKPSSVIDQRLRRTLVDSLYSNPMSLLIGALCGVLVCVYTAYVSDDQALQIVAWVLAGVAFMRVAVMVAVRNVLRAKSSTLELLFEFGAFAYAGSVSLMAALAILHNVSVEAQMVLVVYAVGYATAIAPRNAGRPFIAIGQLLTVMAPLTGALLLSDALLVRVLGVVALLHIPSTVSITINVYRSLRTSIAEAETNERLARKMEVLAHTDIVTGLHNRAGLNDVLAAQVRHGGPDQRIALFWLDLDRFKEVNDLLGHQMGDRVLSEIARRLRDSLPVDAGIARFGGDEFVFFCQIDDRAQCERLANRVLDQITRPMRLDGERLEVSSSIGIATMPEDGVDADRLMQAADLALYHAKQDGRGKLRFFDDEMTRELANRREIEAELRQAIQRDELSLFFQPIIDLQTGRIRCFEALLRWFHPTKGELRPAEFIPVAEETGVIVTLGNWITRQAALACAQWPEDVSVAVNLSPLQIKAPGAVLAIEQALREANLDPRRLELEVTESLFIEDHEQTAAFIDELAAKGVRFALDDFGTGYSSLSYIHKYPFSKIKVDRCFVSGADVGPRAHAIIRAVAAMGRGLDMEIVAEGLEEQCQVETVRDAGCTLGQGYFFSRAVPDYLAAMLLAQDREDDGLRAA